MKERASASYRLVQLANGTWSLRSEEFGETFHPVVGPIQEAGELYVKQLKLPERLRSHGGKFVVWDVGLGAAANALTVLRGAEGSAIHLQMVSFDVSLGALQFALEHASTLDYFTGFEDHLRQLMEQKRVSFRAGPLQVDWELHVTDFPSFVAQPAAVGLPKPHVILFDPFSPAKNPGMWTAPLFRNVFQLLDPNQPCALPTYSRSTMLRVTLLLAGFFVGRGQAIAEKEETTIAANARELIDAPLDRDWLAWVRRSGSAEPMWEPVYRQAPLSNDSWEKLSAHPQFQ